MKYSITTTLVLLVMTSWLVSSCAIVSFSQQPERQKTPSYESSWSHLFLGRAVGSSNSKATCPEDQEISQFEVKLSAGQWWVGLLTQSLYSPVTSRYWCE